MEIFLLDWYEMLNEFRLIPTKYNGAYEQKSYHRLSAPRGARLGGFDTEGPSSGGRSR